MWTSDDTVKHEDIWGFLDSSLVLHHTMDIGVKKSMYVVWIFEPTTTTDVAVYANGAMYM